MTDDDEQLAGTAGEDPDGETTGDGPGEATDGETTGDGPQETPEEGAEGATDERPEGVPVWDDDYFERVGARLMYNYDLERDRTVGGERFDLYGEMQIHTQKHFLHPALSYAEHQAAEHLFAARRESVRVADLERYVDLGHDLAGEWIEADEEHYGTDFSFVLVVPEIPEAVRSFVSGFKNRTMIKYGYHGHYEVNLVVVAPEAEETVASRSTDLDRAFAVWSSPEEESPGLLERLF